MFTESTKLDSNHVYCVPETYTKPICSRFYSCLNKYWNLLLQCQSKGLATLDAFASRHGMDPFRQFVKLSVNEWSRPYWMCYGYVTVNALRHVTDTSISAKSMCVENRIDASSISVFRIFLPRTLKSHLVPTLEAWEAVAKALDLKI